MRQTHFNKEKIVYIKEELEEDYNKIYLAKLKPGPPYAYALLNILKGKKKMDHMKKKIYSFGVDQIFDMLLTMNRFKFIFTNFSMNQFT